MNLKALIARFRVLANDKAEPYFWSDEEVSGWLNDAVHEACLRGRLLHSDDAFVTDVEKGGRFMLMRQVSLRRVMCMKSTVSVLCLTASRCA